MVVCELQATHRPPIEGLLLQNCDIQVSLLGGVWNSGAAPTGVHRAVQQLGVHRGAAIGFENTVFKVTYNGRVSCTE